MNDQSPALSVTILPSELVTKQSADVWTWVKRAIDDGSEVVAEPLMEGERKTVESEGATFDAVMHVSDKKSIARVFDIVTYRQTDLRTLPLSQRRRFLTRALQDTKRQDLQFVPWHVIKSRAALVRAVNRIKLDGAAGVMLKRTDGVVKAGTSEDWAVIRFGAQKADDMVQVKIAKRQDAQQIAIGVVMEPDVADTQEEGASLETIETAANQFLEEYRRGRTILRMQHKTDIGDDEVVLTQHYIAPQDITLGGELVRSGSWVQAWKFNDPSLWARVESGEFTGFSIGGFAQRVPA